VLGYPAVFLGSSPSRTLSMYHLMSSMDLEEGVLYPQGGFSTLIDAIADLARARGVRIRTGATAIGIDTTSIEGRRLSARRARVTGVTFRTAEGVEQVAADVVVGASDLHHLETRLLPSHLQTYP